MTWIHFASAMSPQSKIILIRRIDGSYELAYRRYDDFYTKEGKNVIDYGITLEYWMDIEIPISL